MEYIVPLCEFLFNIRPGIYLPPNKNARYVCLYSKNLVKYLLGLGLESGNKLKNKNKIPRWIFEDESFLKVCIRGLIDTDGSIFKMSNKDPNLLRINFRNFNRILLNDVRKALLQLGFHPSNVIREHTIYLSRRKEVVKYINEIGFSNNKHLKRLKSLTAP